MKYQPGVLSDSDYDTLFTRDPGYFIESIITNILYASGGMRSRPGDAAYVEIQKQVFLKWIGFYTNSLKAELMAEVGELHADHVAELVVAAERRGRILALSNLPFKPNLIGPDKVNLSAVNDILSKLKAQEPVGVIENEQVQAPAN